MNKYVDVVFWYGLAFCTDSVGWKGDRMVRYDGLAYGMRYDVRIQDEYTRGVLYV